MDGGIREYVLFYFLFILTCLFQKLSYYFCQIVLISTIIHPTSVFFAFHHVVL